MTIYLLKKEKNRIYKSEKIVSEVFGKALRHTEEGCPIIDDGYISITDTKNYWACAFWDSPVGIDMEESVRIIKSTVVNRLHAAEKDYLSALPFGSREWKEEFFNIWTKKESYSKYLGKGLAAGFKSFCVLPEYEDTLEKRLYNKTVGSLIFGSTEEIEIKKISYDAPFEKTAVEAGADILDIFGCSAEVLKSKLLKRGYSERDASEAVEKLKEIGFLNDMEYAGSLCRRYEARSYSSKRMELELKKKGVEPKTAKDCAEQYRLSDRERARALAEKELGPDTSDEKLKAKIARKLFSLGYDASIIYDIINE